MVPGAHQMVGGGLAGGVGAVGGEGVGFGEGGISGAKRAVDFVGADVVETEAGFGLGCERVPVSAGRL